jgi:uncharacterized protein
MHSFDRGETRLGAIVSELGSVTVACSGGTDSNYLLAICLDVLGPTAVLAITSESRTIARAEVEHARSQAASLGARLLVLPHDSLANPDFVANGADRCYHCKLGLLKSILEASSAQGMHHVVCGENGDAADDYRPGSRAIAELGVRAPLREAGLTKAEIRALSRQRGLST